MMTKKELLKMDTLRAQLAAERKRSEDAIKAYQENLYELVDVKIKLSRIEAVLRGEE